MWLALCLLAAPGSVATNTCINAKGISAPCGPGNDLCDANNPLANMPQYHIFGGSCDLNDANGIFLDPATNLYHMFFQDHLAEAGGSGPTWGHLVSHDLAHWARLPVAIWNDQAYDDKAIYTGSATIVDGIPTQLYPGICTKGSAACETGVTLAIAVPTNRSDPLLVNWTKPSYNPVIAVSPAPPGSGPYSCGDPSTAWRTASGEWRVATRDTLNSSLFGSADFKKWYHIGRQPGFTSANPTESGACPSVFPLPRTTVGTAAGTINGRTTPTPTHCYMHTTHANGTTIECGTYIDGLPAGPGHSTATVGEWTTSMSHQRVDRGSVGNYFAAKDFWDPVKSRRVFFGWVKIPHGALSLPREITYDSALGQLCFSPLEEQQSLRIAPLIDLQNTTDIPNNGTLLLGDFNRSTFELEVVFTLPEGDAKFGVVLGARQNSARSGGGLQYSRAEGTSSSSSSSSSASWHDKTEQATGQLFYVDYKQGGIVTVGSESAAGSFGSQVLQVAAAETQIRLQLFADGSVVEAYWQGGRVVMTSNVGGSLGSTLGSVGVSSTPSTSSMPVSAVRLEKMTAWGVGSIWVSPEEVLHAAGLRR